MIKAIFKTIACLFLILCYLLTAGVVYFFGRDEFKKKRRASKIVSWYTRKILKVLDIEVIVKDQQNFKDGSLIISNHLSYTDILSLSSVINTSYVTSMEMKKTPFLGEICKVAACVFVERRSRKNIENEIKEIDDALLNNLNVTIFPEATSTNGDKVIPFKRSLFQTSINTKKPISPVVINIKNINEEPVSLKNRDLICWYGDMDFGPHFKEIVRTKKNKIEIRFLPTIFPTHEDDSASLRDKAHQVISKHYKNII